jgi:phospholipid/cholesterol/gamma-HCH transport system permease protein
MDKEHKDKIEEAAKDIAFAPLVISGEIFITFLQMVIDIFDFIGQFLIYLFRSFVYIFTGGMRIGTIVTQMSFLGVDSLPIVILCLGFTGITLASILAQQIEELSYGQELIGGAMSWSMAKELAPVLASLIIAGRAGAGITSEIGTMKVTDQIDALRASAIPPIRYLVVPRLVACLIMVPVICLFATIVGTASGYIAVHYMSPLHISYSTYFDSVKNFFEMDLARILLKKSLIFGAIIAIVGCIKGFDAHGGASGVGKAVTSSVVTSMIMIFFADVLITILKI